MDGSPGPAGTVSRRTRNLLWVGSVALAGVAVAGSIGLPTEPLPGPFVAPWWLLALLYALVEIGMVPNPIGDRPVALREIPLVLGLATASPHVLIAGRLIGSGTVLAVRRFRHPAAALFGIGAVAVEIVAAVWAYRLLIGTDSPVSPRGWLAMLAVVIVGRSTQIAIELGIERKALRRTAFSWAFTLGVAAATGLTSTAGLVALWYDGRAAPLVGAVAILLYAAVRTFGVLRRRYEALEAIFAFTRSATDSNGDSVSVVLEEIRAMFRTEYALLLLAGDDARAADLFTIGPPAVLEHRTVAAPDLIATFARREIEATTLADETLGTAIREATRLPLRSGLAMVIQRGGKPAGLLIAGGPSSADAPDPDHLRLFAAVGRQANLALERGRLVNRLTSEIDRREHAALHDDLTGLPNRAHFSGRLTEALAADGDAGIAILLIDLDHFKEINDTLGHDHGDRILRLVGERLARAVRPDDFIARLGGDEFGVLLHVGTVADAIAIARRIEEILRTPFQHEGLPIEVGASIGISMGADGNRHAVTMLRHADIAMYAAKRAGTRYEIFSPEHQDFSPRRLALAGELRTAIESRAIDVHYQPQVSTEDRRIVGVEALARWHHPSRGPVPPSEFIPIAEKTGLIRPLTGHILRTTMTAAAGWAAAGRPIRLSVNISARSLTDTTLVTLIADLLRASGLDPGLLTLEITESSLIEDGPRTGSVLARIDDLGVGISIDDFGTGYSSLSHVREFPVNEIKVDRSFITPMEGEQGSAIIVGSTIALAHRLGLSVVGEGVETEGVLQILTEAGCDVVQGFLIARPMPEASLLRWLDEYEGRLSDPKVTPLHREPTPRSAEGG
jgi:diguanylate cyclase (GGDEF)-like protein